MRAAAELDRRAHLHHPHHVAVLLREEGHRAERERVRIGHLARDDLLIRQHQPVHLVLDGLERGGVDRAVVREVEPEPLGLHQRSLLPHVRAQEFPEGVMHEVRGAVVPLDVVPPRRVHRRAHGLGLERLAEAAAHHGALGILPHGVDRE